MITFILYFIIGLVQDVIITWNTQTIIEEKAWAASMLSILNTFINGTVILSLVALSDSILNLGAYAFGGGLGVAGMILFRKRRTNGKIQNDASKSIIADEFRANRKSNSKYRYRSN